VRETPALYERVVRPYIDAFPSERTQWSVHPCTLFMCAYCARCPHWIEASLSRIDAIVSGRSEAEKVLFRSPSEADPFGFLILPDMKWDLANLTSLYLVALMLLPDIKSLRDLNRSHLPLLRSIRHEAARVVKDRWGLEATELRLFVHYQPSYCKLRLIFHFPSPSRKEISPLARLPTHRPLSRPHRKRKSYGSYGDDCWPGAHA
jgi:m7GpppX diphosphatase